MTLARYRILVVEDQFMLAQDICNELEEAGAEVIGPEPSLERALARIAQEPHIDGAVLDISLGDGTSFPIADLLTERNVPFLFASGYDDEAVADLYPHAVSCAKPLDMPVLIRTMADIIKPA
ncbi:response regulator [Novosphingobium rosa]|uniref:response regulator n=1 Tax=Novosphingobium rosa TaxID=76978 RepID=UPI000829E8DF|nr:response regulator [Novosphingobium rosa]